MRPLAPCRGCSSVFRATRVGGRCHTGEMPTTATSEPTTTGHNIGLVQASALYIAAVLGTGILVLPGLAAQAAGPASIVAVVAVLAASIPLAGTFAALAARYPDAGGVATFVRLAIGPTAARMCAYWFFFGVTFGAPIVAILGGEYLAAAIGADRAVVPWLGIAFLAVPIIVNFFGLRVSAALQLGLTGLLLAVVVGVILVSVPAVEPARFEPFLPNGWAGVGVAVSLFVWAFAGWEAVTHIAAEFRNPRRTIPIATAIAVVVVGLAYVALQVVTVGLLGSGRPQSQVPLIDLVAVTLPGVGPLIVAVISSIVVIGVLNAYVPAFANLAASLGRDGDLPRWFAKGSEAGSVPRRGLALWTVVAACYYGVALARGLDLGPLILVQTSSIVAVYAAGMVAAVVLLERFRLGWWMAAISVVLTGGLLVLAGVNLLIPALLSLAAIAVTLVKKRMHHA